MLERPLALCCLVALGSACSPSRGRQLCEAIGSRQVATVQQILSGPRIDLLRAYGTCVPVDVFGAATPDDAALTAIGVELVKAGLPADASWIPAGQTETVSAIEAAARNGNVELVRALIAVGLDVTSLESGRALVEAAAAGHLPVVRLLIEGGVDVEATFRGDTARDRARAHGHTEIVEFLDDALAARTSPQP